MDESTAYVSVDLKATVLEIRSNSCEEEKLKKGLDFETLPATSFRFA